MQAYFEYKESNIPWLGKVPKHWRLLPCRAIVDNQIKKNEGAENQEYLSLMANIGVIRYEDKGDVGNKKPDDLAKCKLVKRGNLVINSMNYAIGSYGMSPYDGVCSPVYIVLEPNESLVERRFALRLFENKPMQKHLALLGNGILEHRAAIKWDDIKSQHVPVPPLEEQKAILDFLDQETARIDNLIAEKQTFINLLKEKRQALISHVVTKGLDPNVKMKDSGVEWIGEVPEHWDVLLHRRLINTIEQGWSPQADSNPPNDNQWGVTKLSAVKSGSFYPGECKAMLDEHDPSKGLRVNEGDFLITRANTPELVGDVCIVGNLDDRKIIICDLIYKLIYDKSTNPRYMMYWFLGQPARAQIKIDARGSSMTMAKIAQSHIKSWKIPVPPIEEQGQAVAYLDQVLSKLYSISKEVEASIDYLREHRTALISAAVTGKIDVRNQKEKAA